MAALPDVYESLTLIITQDMLVMAVVILVVFQTIDILLNPGHGGRVLLRKMSPAMLRRKFECGLRCINKPYEYYTNFMRMINANYERKKRDYERKKRDLSKAQRKREMLQKAARRNKIRRRSDMTVEHKVFVFLMTCEPPLILLFF
jgi:hypothetical protein